MKARRMRSAAPKSASAETASSDRSLPSETAAGLVEAGALDELRRGDAGLLGEAAGEAALAHGGAGGQQPAPKDRRTGFRR